MDTARANAGLWQAEPNLLFASGGLDISDVTCEGSLPFSHADLVLSVFSSSSSSSKLMLAIRLGA